jgi:hypothetical protein
MVAKSRNTKINGSKWRLLNRLNDVCLANLFSHETLLLLSDGQSIGDLSAVAAQTVHSEIQNRTSNNRPVGNSLSLRRVASDVGKKREIRLTLVEEVASTRYTKLWL